MLDVAGVAAAPSVATLTWTVWSASDPAPLIVAVPALAVTGMR